MFAVVDNAMPMNSVLRNTAMRYARIKECLIAASQPMTETEIYEIASVKETCKGPYNVKDALKALRKDGVVRRVPVCGIGRARYGFEIIMENIKQHGKKPTNDESNAPERTVNVAKENARLIDHDQLPVLRALLTQEEYIGFLKGCLIIDQASRDYWLQWIKETKS